MKKTLIIITLIFVIVISVLIGLIIANNIRATEVRIHNQQYARYLEREIWGTELTGLINRAMDNNRRNGVMEDEQGNFINNGINSINIDIEMTTVEDTFSMERIYRGGTTEFVQAFNFVKFQSSSIEYHEQTGKISRITFRQLTDN